MASDKGDDRPAAEAFDKGDDMVGERARNAHRVLKLREMGYEETSLEAIEPPEPVEDGTEQAIGGGNEHPAVGTLRALRKSQLDGHDVGDLFEMSNEQLLEEWRNRTAAFNEEIDAEGMTAAWASQDRDLEEAETKPRSAEELVAQEEE